MSARNMFAVLALLAASIVLGDEEEGQQKASSSNGVAASFSDFHQYMQQYGRKGDAGGFQKYVKYMEFSRSRKTSSPGQGFDDFSKYLQLHGDAPVSYTDYTDYAGYMQNHAQFSDFQNYLTNKGKQAPNYKQYLDLQKYTQGQQGPAAPDYQKYLNVDKFVSSTRAGGPAPAAAAPRASTVLLADKDSSSADAEASDDMQGAVGQDASASNMDYKKYMDYQKYMDYSKYTGSSSSSSSQDASPGGGGASYSQFMDYSKYVPGHYMKYSDYSKYMKGGQNGLGGVNFASMQGQAQVPYSASDCKTPEELEAWHERQLDTIHSWIPAQFQGHALSNIEQDYKTNKERLAGHSDALSSKQLPPLQQADASSSEQQPPLQQAAVPKASGDPVVEKALADAKAALAKSEVVGGEPAAKAPQALLQTPPLAVKLPASASSTPEQKKVPASRASRALLVLLAGLAVPAVMAFLGAGRSSSQAKQEQQQPEPDHYITLHAEDEEQAML